MCKLTVRFVFILELAFAFDAFSLSTAAFVDMLTKDELDSLRYEQAYYLKGMECTPVSARISPWHISFCHHSISSMLFRKYQHTFCRTKSLIAHSHHLPDHLQPFVQGCMRSLRQARQKLKLDKRQRKLFRLA